MNKRLSSLILLCLLLLAGAWLLWQRGQQPAARQKVGIRQAAITTTRSASTAPVLFASQTATTNAAVKTNRFAYRLNNAGKSIGQLMNNPHAILLDNALLDTGSAMNISIPKHLKSSGDPGAYIVQAAGPINNAFRTTLAAAGAQIVSYIPNNAYLVTASAGSAAGLTGQAGVQSVLPYEPYYKISAALLGLAVDQKKLPDDPILTLGLFANGAARTEEQIKQLGATVVATDQSPFGPIVRVQPPANWTALAALPGVQIVELAHRRALANDLARVTLGIATDTITPTNYMNLYGSNVLVEINDSGVDVTHPDFSFGKTAESVPLPTGPLAAGASRVTASLFFSTIDTIGHGTLVAGIIGGNGWASYTVTNTPQGSVTNADFRGKAPGVQMFSYQIFDNNGNNVLSDQQMQAAPAKTNAIISNNSWNYTGDNAYDLSAASYDAAVRDALPLVTGSQPVLFVFAAGNDGGGLEDGTSGDADTILSPGTAKNVITVGALEQLRGITNVVTDAAGNSNEVWHAATDNPYQVAGYSARGNVGVGSEGPFGRFKPDVVAPGSFVVSTVSSQWNQAAYYNPTNYYYEPIGNQFVNAGSKNNYSLSLNFIPPNISLNSNVVSVHIEIQRDADSPTPFPVLPIYVSHNAVNGYPDPGNPSSYDFVTYNNQVSIPPDGGASYLSQIQGGNLYFTIVNTNSERVGFVINEIITATNQAGNYFTVLSNLNNSIGPWYRYESGTSMATPAVSGSLALIQDYFTNTLHATPSPALLKAMLINGSRPVGTYTYAITNGQNFEGWGLPSLPDSVPPGLTNAVGAACSTFFQDQSPTNALATGDRQTFTVKVDTNSFAADLPLQVTLAWTDPPGNPAAAIKLVNNLILVVTNLDTGDVFFGNDIPPNTTFNLPWQTNSPPNLDTINNVQNIILPPTLGVNYSVTVIGRSVNVNAVTAQTNNVVQDYALVIACGEGEVTNAIMVSPDNLGIVSNPLNDQQITVVGIGSNGEATNSGAIGGVFLNQLTGASTPLLGTNMVGAVSNYTGNAVVTIGMTNQWHFYIVQNTTGFTNAAFVTFLPDTLSMPRMGVYALPTQNPTQPEADIDLYVATGPGAAGLTNLDPVVVSNCVNGVNGNASSLTTGGTEFVAYNNSQPNQVYYIGVKSETAIAGEFGFFPIFSELPFSTTVNGVETVNGLLLPTPIPDGSPKHPGTAYIFALATQPIQVQDVIVSNQIVHQNFGDLVGTLSHNNINVVLNNHDSLLNPPGPYSFTYDESPLPVAGSQAPDGPGTLKTYQGQAGIGPWILTEVDDALTHTGAVTGFTLTITPHKDLLAGVTVTLPPGVYFFGFIDVPVGATNLTISATNITLTAPGPGAVFDPAHPGILYEKLGEQPAPPPTPLTNYDKSATLNNPGPTGPGATITVGPSDVPPLQPGRYFVTLWNNSTNASQTFYIIATLGIGQVQPVDFNPSGPVPILDDAVSYAYITNRAGVNATNETIASIAVGIRVEHPRISDLVFTLISPNGTRYLLMENRGGTSTNGAGATIVTTNIFSGSASGGPAGATNFYNLNQTSGTIPITWNFYTVPDKMDVYYQGTNIFSTGLISGTGATNISFGPGTSTYVEVIMDQPPYPNPTTAWTYTIGGVQTNFVYLEFTEDTNLTTTPIKFAPTPFTPGTGSGIVWTDSFEAYLPGAYPPSIFGGAWTVLANAVQIVTNPPAFNGVNELELDNGAVSTTLPTVTGQKYLLSYQLGSLASDSGGPSTSANWQTVSYTFTASQNNTPLVLNASGTTISVAGAQTLTFNTNALLDAFTLVAVPGNLYYQPEQDISPLIGTSAYGLWTLEIQDDRVGATNNTVLDSWQLQFVFANTNSTGAASLTPGTEICNTYPAGDTLWYRVNVPLNAIFATNTLISADLPVNLLFNTNSPSTNGASVLLPNATNGVSILSSTNGSPLLVPGSTYYLGVQNPNSVQVNACIEVDFDLLATAYAFTEPAQLVTGTSSQLNGFATPNGYPATAWFEWGTNTTYGNQTPAVSVGAGYGVVYVTNAIFNLVTNVPYHFRLVVSNLFAVVPGYDQILDEANVVTWGPNYSGQQNVPTNLNNITAIAGAYDHSLALNTNGLVAAWGDNTFGQASVPASLSNAVMVAVAGGEYFSMALKSDGTVTSWGAKLLNQTNVPAGLSNVVLIAGGTYSSLALRSDGTISAWGANFFGLNNVPAGASNAVAVASGSYHSLALKNDGTVMVWGDNSAGQTNVPAGLNTVVAIAAGGYHSLALKNDGTVVAWGDNTVGQTNVPAGLNNVVAIAAGGFHSLALKGDGTIVSWGDNSAGQRNVPGGLTNFVAIAAGYLHSLALTPQSLANLTNVIIDLVPGLPQNGSILPGGITYYLVSVPTNADFATNRLLSADAPLNVWFTTNTPPSIANNAFLLLAGKTNGAATLATNFPPPNIVPGAVYYLGLQNTNSFTVNFSVEVDFHLVTSVIPPPFTNVITISSIVYTNIGGTNGFLLTWFAPSNDLFQVQWSGGLPPVWNTFSNIVSFNPAFYTNGPVTQFNFFDDGSQTGGFGPTRFYRLVQLGSLLKLTNGVPQTSAVAPGSTAYFSITVPSNADYATNGLLAATAPVNLLFNQNGLPTGTNSGGFELLTNSAGGISVLGGATTPPLVPGATYYLGVQNTNSFTVQFTLQVNFHLQTLPTFYPISSVVYSNGNFALSWIAPTNDLFGVQVATNLALPIAWQTIATNIAYIGPVTPSNGIFSFTDTNASLLMKFYELILLP